jgi:hypothetical protein
MSDESLVNNEATAATAQTETQEQVAKTYTQEEFDRHMAGMKNSLQKKYEKTLTELGDLDELRALKTQAEQRKTEEAMKKGEFERILQDKAAKWEAEISKRDSVITEYKVNTPLLSAAARYRAVAPEQVKSLLTNQVRLGQDGEVEVVGSDGTVRYQDNGQPLTVELLVREFLDSNPHFVQAAPSTTNTKTNISQTSAAKIDITKLDMRNPEHRKVYAEYRKTAGIA